MLKSAVFLVGLAVAGSAMGQQVPHYAVYDATGRLVGPLVGKDNEGEGLVIVKLFSAAYPQGLAHFLPVVRNSFGGATVLYFMQPDCQGAVFVPYDRAVDIIPTAAIDLSVGTGLIYGVNIDQVSAYTFQSFRGNGYQCSNGQVLNGQFYPGPFLAEAAPGISVKPSTFMPPFTVKP